MLKFWEKFSEILQDNWWNFKEHLLKSWENIGEILKKIRWKIFCHITIWRLIEIQMLIFSVIWGKWMLNPEFDPEFTTEGLLLVFEAQMLINFLASDQSNCLFQNLILSSLLKNCDSLFQFVQAKMNAISNI